MPMKLDEDETSSLIKYPYLALRGVALGAPKFLSDITNLLKGLGEVAEPYLYQVPKESLIGRLPSLSDIPDVPSGMGLESLVSALEEKVSPGIGIPETGGQKLVSDISERMMPSALTMGLPGILAAMAGPTASRAAKVLGAGKGTQVAADIASSIAAGKGSQLLKVLPAGLRREAQKESSRIYENIRDSFKGKTFGTDQINVTVDKVLDEARKSPGTLREPLYNSLKHVLTERMQPILDNPNVAVSDIMKLDQEIGKLAYSKGAIDRLKPFYGDIKRSIEKTINAYGKADKDFVPAYNAAKSLWRMSYKKPGILGRLNDKISELNVKDSTKNLIKWGLGVTGTSLGGAGAVLSPALTATTGALGGLGAVAAKTVKGYIDILKEPLGRKLFAKLGKDLFVKNNYGSIVPIAKKLDRVTIKKDEVTDVEGALGEKLSLEAF